MPDATKFGGLDQETMNQIAEDKTKAVNDNQSDSGDTQTDTSQQQGKEQTQEQNESAQNQTNSGETEADASEGEQKELIDYVKNTYGVPEEEIQESHLKIAKSAKESQREFNRFYNNEFQPVKKKAEAFENYDQFLQQNPDLMQEIENRAKGNKENPTQSESRNKVNSNSQGKLDDDLDVDEKTLVEEGYVNQSDLDQMDELARERALAKAEIKYLREQGTQMYKNDLRDTYEKEQQRLEQQRREQKLKEKYNQSFDSFLNEYPQIDFSKPEYNQHLDKINEMTKRLIDVEDDPFKVSAELVLNREGKLPTRENQTQNNMDNVQQKMDSGVNINKGRQQSKQPKKNALDRQVEKRRQQLRNPRKTNKQFQKRE